MLKAKLTQKAGPEPGRIYFISPAGVSSIGRLSSNTIYLPGKGVSRKHCLIEVHDNIFTVKDLESTNETLVNGRSISEHILTDGDEITIGEYILSFSFSSEETAENTLVSNINPVYIDEEAETIINQTLSEKDAIYTDPLQIKVTDTNYERVCRDLSILCDVSKAINSENDLTQILERLLDFLLQATQSERCVIYLKTEKEQGLKQAAVRLRAAQQPPLGTAQQLSLRDDQDVSPQVPLSRTIAEHVLNQAESVLCTNIATDSRFKNAQSMIILGQRSVLCVPLKSGKKIIGLLYADTLAKNNFSKDDLQLFTAIGNQAGVAINNVLLYNILEEQKQLNEDIVENIDEGVLVVNSQGLIIFANSRIEELTGYRIQRNSLHGKKISEVFPYLENLDKNYEEVFRSGETLVFEGGAIEYTLIPVKDEKTTVEKIVTVLRRV